MKIKNAKIEGNKIFITSSKIEIPVLLAKDIANYSFKVIVSKPKKLPKYLPELKFDILHLTDKNEVIGGERFIIPIKKYKPIKK